MALLAEDVLLLVLDPDTGVLRIGSKSRLLLGGAVLSELSLGRYVELEDRTGMLHFPKVRSIGARPEPGLLAEAWVTVTAKPRTPQDLVDRLGKGVKERVVAGLVARGTLREDRGRWLGMVPRSRWPAASAVRDDTLRQRVSAALVLGQEPDPRTRAVVALLSAADVAHKVIDTQRLPARQVRKRAKVLAEGDWAAKGVRDAISAAAPGAAG